MKNKITDLNNHLFAQLERLGDEDMTQEELEREISRTDAVVKVADKIIGSANVAIQAAKLVNEAGGNYQKMLPMIGGAEDIDKDHPALAPPKGNKA